MSLRGLRRSETGIRPTGASALTNRPTVIT